MISDDSKLILLYALSGTRLSILRHSFIKSLEREIPPTDVMRTKLDKTERALETTPVWMPCEPP